MASGPPTGTVTFLFTDLEGSTRLWEEHPEAMKGALARHDELLRTAVEAHGGHIVKTTGDGIHAAFVTANDAVGAAVEGQLGIATEPWERTGALRVRMGVHTGAAQRREGDYYGAAVNRAARLMAAAHGGQVVVSRASEELLSDALPDGMRLLDLGEHRLRDLSRPERVFQVCAPGLEEEFAALRSLDAFPGNLPVQLTSFVGREDEVARLARALDDARLVTLIGVGGVGKTRLAIQVAAEALPHFPDGAWLCELAAASDAETLASVVAASLGVSSRSAASLEEAIFESIRTKRMLILLDNCEHLLDAVGSLAAGLLRHCPQVRVLATSREGLAIEGEQVWPLRSLPLPDAGDEPNVSANDSIHLFVDRARAVGPAFTLDRSNTPAVVEICRRLDGMPLAIELAAARTAAMSPAEIAGLLDERFRLLTGGRRTAVERHQTLRATVDWSYSLLEPHERVVFDRLGVFAGTFDAADAAAVAADEAIEPWGVREALLALVGKSLVLSDETTGGVTRYQMLETLRQYARERLDERGDADAYRRRHAMHYADFAEEAGPALLGADEFRWRARVGVELDNLRAAVTWSLDRDEPDDVEFGIRIVASLAYEATMRRTAGITAWAEAAVPKVGTTTPGRRAAVLGTAAFAAVMRGDIDEIEKLAGQALEGGIAPDNPAPNMAIIALALAHMYAGDQHGAVELSLRYAGVLDEIGAKPFDRSNLLVTVAIWAIHAGELDTAREVADQALRLAQETKGPSGLAMTTQTLAWAREAEDPREALARYEESVALTRAGASDVMLTNALARIAKLRAWEDDVTGAIDALREAIVHAYDDGDPPGESGAFDAAIHVFSALGDDETAVTLAGCILGGMLAAIRLTPVHEVPARDRVLEDARSKLGDDRSRAAYDRGAAFTYDEAVELALNRLDELRTGIVDG